MSKKHRKHLSPEALQKREACAFHRKIRKVFCDMGFSYIATQGQEFQLGNRSMEIDAAYVKDNILLLCEDTVGKNSNVILSNSLTCLSTADRTSASSRSFICITVLHSLCSIRSTIE